MKIRMQPVIDPGDSLSWWPRRLEALKRYEAARAALPEVPSASIYQYLNALAEGFSSMLPEPRARFQFFVADTLNASIWAAGSGFYIIHAGLFSLVRDQRELAFILALEFAHESLGHNKRPIGSWNKSGFRPTAVFNWALIANGDPVENARFSYTTQQESDALELVYRFFVSRDWRYDDLAKTIAGRINLLNSIRGTSSLPLLHRNLEFALKLPHDRPKPASLKMDPVVNIGTVTRALTEMSLSGLQRYQWMREIIPYRKYLIDENVNVSDLRERTEAEIQKLGQYRHGEHVARKFLRANLLMQKRDWAAVQQTAEEALRLVPRNEPFLWFHLLSRQHQLQFKECGDSTQPKWPLFDHMRQLIVGQCMFLDGRLSNAAQHFMEYRRRYPFDVHGAFWQAFVDLHMRRKGQDNIAEMERFWGNRPYVRAVKVLHYGALGKPTDAKAAQDVINELEYGDTEWGALELVNSWFAETYSPYNGRDEKAQNKMKRAEMLWPLSGLIRAHMLRHAWEER